MAYREPKKHKLDDKRWFTCAPEGNGRYHYEVFEAVTFNNQLGRHRLFSTSCKARRVADVEAHVREELNKYLENVTTEEFDEALEELVDGMSGAELLQTPGVYEVLSEALNNEAIKLALEIREAKEDKNGSAG